MRRTGKHTWSIVLTLASTLLIGFPATAHADDAAVADVNAQLAGLNTDFRGWYADRRAEVMAEQPLILVVSNSGVTAIRNGQQAKYSVDLTAYTQVKSVLHAVLGFQGLMRSTVAAGQQPDWAEVEQLIGQLQDARALIPSTLIPEDLQPGVVGAYDTLIDTAQRALDRRWVTHRNVESALRSARDGVMPAVLWIGREHARNIRSVLQTAKRDATPEEWSRVVAVATGPMTPRRDNLETAVTAKVLGPQWLGSRIFYSENLFSTTDALNYLGTVLTDAQFSEDMFESSTRMWRDVFAPVSREYVADGFYTALADS